jgi:hypothetical protein
MAFHRISGGDRGAIRRTISSLACSVGDLMVYNRTSYKVEAAQASSEIDNLAGVCIEATTTDDTSVLLERIMPGDVYKVGTINAADATHNYQRMIWGTAHTANNTGTDVAGDTGIFMQTGVVGTSEITGEFVTGSVGD